MLRAACRFMSNQLVAGWNRWVEFLIAEKRAVNVVSISLGRLRHKRVAQAWTTWLQLDLDRVRWSSQEAKEARHKQALNDFRNVTEVHATRGAGAACGGRLRARPAGRWARRRGTAPGSDAASGSPAWKCRLKSGGSRFQQTGSTDGNSSPRCLWLTALGEVSRLVPASVASRPAVTPRRLQLP